MRDFVGLRKGMRMVSLLVALLLSACAWETEHPGHTVRFVENGVVTEQTVVQGQLPRTPDPQPTGAVFVGWQDDLGQTVVPAELPVTQDVTYTAVFRPVLSSHVPYLQLDGDGMLCPDEALTWDALCHGLNVLAAEGAAGYFPEIPTGTEAVDGLALAELLENFFAPETVPAIEEGAVTRARFAQVMHSLLGREDGERLVLSQGTLLPTDVNLERDDLAALLEACVSHTSDPEGVAWKQLDLKTAHEPGFVHLDGWLYYVQEDHTFLLDGDLGRLHFGADGRYTCGDEELDALVAAYWKDVMAENPEATRLELLKIAYEHCHRDFQYLRRELYTVGQTGWEVEDAKEMLTTGRGNCYNFAAIFWAYARGLGYEARAISGTCTDTDQPHGWVIIEMDGADYFFDPEWQYAYRDRGERGKDMFMIPKDQTWYWSYKWKE